MNFILSLAILLFSTQQVSAADFFDGFYNKLTRVFSSEKCHNPAANPPSVESCSAQNIKTSNRRDLQSISENVFYNRLAELEIDRLKCAGDEWGSYSNKTKTGMQNQEIMIAKINNILPDLQLLKTEIGKLVSETQLLRGKLPANFQSGQKMLPRYEVLKKEFNDKNEKAKQLMGAYELRLGDIPNSDQPVVRAFIEDHLPGFFSFSKKVTPVKPEEFQKLVNEITAGFNNNINEINRTKVSGNYNLSIRQQAQFSSDPTLIAQLTSENRSAVQTLPYLQCSAKNRMQTKELTELAATGVSLLMPLGSIAVAKAARAAVVLRSPQLAYGFEQGARAMGWASMIAGGAQSTQGIYNSCFSKAQSRVKGECKQNPQSIIEKHERSTCVWEAVLSATPGLAKIGGGFLIKKLADNTTPMAKFVQKMSGRNNLRAQDLNFAGSLSNEDRILAAKGILGRQKDFSKEEKDAIIAAHKVGGFKTYGQYSDSEIEQKREIMKAAGFSDRESETLLWKGITGYSKAEMLPLVQKRATEFFGRSVTAKQAEAILGDNILQKEGIRLEKLTDVGFTPQQAQEIVDQKLHRVGISATLMAPAPSNFNPFVQSSRYQGSVTPESLKRIANGANITDTEAIMGLSSFAANNKITGSSSAEIKSKAMQELAKQTFNDAENVQKALSSPRLSDADKKNLTESYNRLKDKCRALPGFAMQAGLNGSTLQANLQSRIREVCN